MTFSEAVEYLQKQLPMFHRIGPAAYKANLDNIIELCKQYNNPQNKLKTIHIAGTNGKGSTSHYLSSIFQSAGYKTALFTSPHLKDFRERIKIDGKMIDEDYVCRFVEESKETIKQIKPSFFELTTILAFKYFAEQMPDIAIIETGLGGRLDSTNVINPILSIITNISYDHTNLLGDTMEKIAIEKAGIIKPNTAVVIGESNNSIDHIFEKKAQQCQSKTYFASKNFNIKNFQIKDYQINSFTCDIFKKNTLKYPNLISGLSGHYQQKNLLTVCQSLEIIEQLGFNITETYIRQGLKDVVLNTNLMGRWQILSTNPLTICDTGHNIGGITEICHQIGITPHNQLHFVFGVVEDKDLSPILSILPKNASYYFCKPNIPRGLNVNELHALASKKGLKGNPFENVDDAYQAAKRNAKSNDLIFIGGSTFVVAEVL